MFEVEGNGFPKSTGHLRHLGGEISSWFTLNNRFLWFDKDMPPGTVRWPNSFQHPATLLDKMCICCTKTLNMWELRLFYCGPRWGYHFQIIRSDQFLWFLHSPQTTTCTFECVFVNWCDGMNLISSKDFHEPPGCLSATEPVVAIWIWQSFCSARCRLIQGFHYLCFRQDEHLPFWGWFPVTATPVGQLLQD